ncbi:MAG: radical SAM protein [Spirochaetes bacterium]|nr:radical SAM protein [Spirochaetota bacterium]
MNKTKYIIGTKKKIIILRIKLGVFIHFLPIIFKIGLKNFILFLKRLLIFIKLISENKFFKINNKIKIHLYIPLYPSKAFFYASNKFLTFNEKPPCTTVLISVTSACRFNCKHCYQRNDKGKDIDIKKLIETVKKIQDMGVAFFNIEGGDPFLVYERLKNVCKSIDDISEIWINSTGDGITYDRLKELMEYNVKAIMFSLHYTTQAEINNFMGRSDAWDILNKGIEICHKVGMTVTINSCLLKEDFKNNKFEKIMDLSKDLGASLIQLIVPKRAGAWLESKIEHFSEDDYKIIKSKISIYNLKTKFQNYPVISSQAIEEDKDHFGCTAGGTDRFYINAKGDVQPCEFLNISFGNIAKEDFNMIYKRMRTVFNTPCCGLMCEKLGKKIFDAYKNNKLKTLPLDENLSKVIYKGWDRGEETEFYKRIELLK